MGFRFITFGRQDKAKYGYVGVRKKPAYTHEETDDEYMTRFWREHPSQPVKSFEELKAAVEEALYGPNLTKNE